MVSLEDVARLAAALPEVIDDAQHGNRSWSVGGRGFAWERPFSKADLRRYGDETPPEGPILAVRVADLHEKEAVLAAGHAGFFTIPHFNGYAAVLINLPEASGEAVRAALTDGWLSRAPRSLADRFLSGA